jgi:hypothetical protein
VRPDALGQVAADRVRAEEAGGELADDERPPELFEPLQLLLEVVPLLRLGQVADQLADGALALDDEQLRLVVPGQGVVARVQVVLDRPQTVGLGLNTQPSFSPVSLRTVYDTVGLAPFLPAIFHHQQPHERVRKRLGDKAEELRLVFLLMAAHLFMTGKAQRDSVGHHEPEGRVVGPPPDVVGVQLPLAPGQPGIRHFHRSRA